MPDVQNVVLVHGGFVDGSGWQGVYDLLTADGFNVSIVQNQTLSLESDVRTTHNVLDLLDGPAILVGHSYGGAVISEAGRHERVAGLVYIAAFAPDAGESVNTLIADPPPGAPVPPILPPVDGFGDELHIEFPHQSGRRLTLAEVTLELAERLVSIFREGEDGRRPVFGARERFQRDPAWRDALHFHEYFHGDNGAGLGASHQTGWTGLVADMIVRLSNARRSA